MSSQHIGEKPVHQTSAQTRCFSMSSSQPHLIRTRLSYTLHRANVHMACLQRPRPYPWEGMVLHK